MFDGLVVFEVDRWHGLFYTTRITNEGMIRSEYLPFRTQVLYQPRQNDRHHVMFGTSLCIYHSVTLSSDITPTSDDHWKNNTPPCSRTLSE
ncbi:hypothetical protein TNCV_243921 [Trichonephila clavipes]|uniref:Uncharacterized protein n=1 Tax=Trichonephila clavipes TaxID=2585209 RepID=A0A8X6RLA2_TRICX|nr:hypothetical protein TNCV_243921 [Trichonephila clavipes]